MSLFIISQLENKKENKKVFSIKKKLKEMLAGYCGYLSELLYSNLYKSAATDAVAKLTKMYGAL